MSHANLPSSDGMVSVNQRRKKDMLELHKNVIDFRKILLEFYFYHSKLGHIELYHSIRYIHIEGFGSQTELVDGSFFRAIIVLN